MAPHLDTGSLARRAIKCVGLGRLVARGRRWRIARHPPITPYGDKTPHYRSDLGIFVFHGSHREIGTQYARAVPASKELAHASAFLERLYPSSRKELEKTIDQAISVMEAELPGVRLMMDGMLDVYNGCGLRVLALTNLAPMLVDWKHYQSCGGIAFRKGGNAIIGQNLDLGLVSDTAPAYILPDDEPARIVHMNPRTLWFTTGLNEYGFCYAGGSVNVARKRGDYSGAGLATTFIGYYLTSRARDCDHAIGLLQNGPRWGPDNDGANLVLADSGGRISRAEITGRDVAIAEDGESVVVATSHFRIPQLSPLNRRSDKACRALHDNSVARFEAARTWAATAEPDITRLRKLLRNQKGSGAWCRTASPPDLGWTSASYVIDPVEARFEFWSGVAFSNPVRRSIDVSFLYERRLP